MPIPCLWIRKQCQYLIVKVIRRWKGLAENTWDNQKGFPSSFVHDQRCHSCEDDLDQTHDHWGQLTVLINNKRESYWIWRWAHPCQSKAEYKLKQIKANYLHFYLHCNSLSAYSDSWEWWDYWFCLPRHQLHDKKKPKECNHFFLYLYLFTYLQYILIQHSFLKYHCNC